MSSRRRSDDEGLMLIALIVIVALLILAFLAAQAIAVVVRATAAHASNRMLRIAWGVALVATLPALLIAGRVMALNVVAGVGLGLLVATAWGVETYYDTLFKRAFTRERLVHEVIGPWW
jgi:hypothetical protein